MTMTLIESKTPLDAVEKRNSSRKKSTENASQTDATDGRVDPVLASNVEALLVSTDRPMTAGRIADALSVGLDEGGTGVIEQAIQSLNEVYEQSGRSFRIERVAGGYRMMTRSEFGAVLASARESRSPSKVSQAALETLAIIAYRQPITRADIEAIRGVSCGEVVRTLLDRHLVRIVGRADEVGRPMLYGTTKQFLESFGLASLSDLPKDNDLEML
jgi:segregation and condensation protein B